MAIAVACLLAASTVDARTLAHFEDPVALDPFPIDATCLGSTDAWVFPGNGATEVPRNVRLVTFGGSLPTATLIVEGTVRTVSGGEETPDAGPLAAHRAYTLEVGARQFGFVTSGTVDWTRPPPPEILRFALAASNTEDVIDLVTFIRGDGAFLEVTLADSSGEPMRRLLAPPSGISATAPKECAGFYLLPTDRVCVHVRAVDLAGNRSDPTVTCATVVDRQAPQSYACPRPFVDDHPSGVAMTRTEKLTQMAFVWLGAVGLAGLVAVLRGRRARRAQANAADAAACTRDAVYDAAARAVAIDVALLIAASATGFLVAGFANTIALGGWYALPAVFVVALLAFDIARAYRCMSAAFEDEATATYAAGRAYITRHGWLIGWQRASARRLERHGRCSLPTARLVRVR